MDSRLADTDETVIGILSAALKQRYYSTGDEGVLRLGVMTYLYGDLV